jgi:hypothetical protein
VKLGTESELVRLKSRDVRARVIEFIFKSISENEDL